MQLLNQQESLLRSHFNPFALQILKPYRDIRPINSGPAYTDEMIVAVRALNFDLD